MTNAKKPNLQLVEDDFEVPEDVIDEGHLAEVEREAGEEIAPVTAKPEEQFWYGFDEFAAIERVREYIIKGWLIAHGVTALLAKRGTGKSTVALDLGCHLACDMDWWGVPAMEGWKVIYLCGEDDEGMILNCRAWEMYHKREVRSDRFRISKGIIKLTDARVMRRRLDEMVEWADGARCLIILDTWSRAVSGHSTNTQEEMDIAYENAEAIAAALNGPMIACFHPPKDGRMTIRGSAVQEDASSGIWELEEDGANDSIRLTIGRAKGKGRGNYRLFRLEPTNLPGVDFYGDPLQGIVPVCFAGTDRNGVEALAAQREKFRIEQLAYADLMLTVHLAGSQTQWSIDEMAKAIKGLSVEIEGTMVEVLAKTTAGENIVRLFGLPVSLPERRYRVVMTGSSKAGPGGGRQITFEEITKADTDAISTGESAEEEAE